MKDEMGLGAEISCVHKKTRVNDTHKLQVFACEFCHTSSRDNEDNEILLHRRVHKNSNLDFVLFEMK